MIPAALTDILEAGIDAMAPPDFNFSYGLPDVWPQVDTGAPLVYIETPDETAVKPGESVVGRYTLDAPLSFRVLVPTSASGSFSIDEQVVKVVNDFKALFHDLESELRAAGMTYADLAGAQKTYRLVRAYPAQVIITFNIRYRQVMSAPGG